MCLGLEDSTVLLHLDSPEWKHNEDDRLDLGRKLRRPSLDNPHPPCKQGGVRDRGKIRAPKPCHDLKPDAASRGGHKKPKRDTETELTKTKTECIETDLTATNFSVLIRQTKFYMVNSILTLK
jgi:hypothetical protein